jgi:hemoglobin
LTTAHFDRWLQLFDETVDELFDGPVADRAKARAATMARAIQRLLRGRPDPGSSPIEVRWRR